MSLLERLLVPNARSFISASATLRPRRAASRAIPAPVMPPPMIRTSTGPESRSHMALRVGIVRDVAPARSSRRRWSDRSRWGAGACAHRGGTSVAGVQAVGLLVRERRQRARSDLQGPHGPHVVEDAVAQGRLVEVVDAGRAARPGAAPDHALDHARVALAKD